MSPEDKSRCERECTRLSTDFAWTVDARAYDAFVALFAPDGVFERAGQPSRGHEAIRHVLTSGGWKFKYRRTTVVFQP